MTGPPSVRPPFPTARSSAGVGRPQTALSGAEKIAVIARVNDLERVLFDGEGHVQGHTGPDQADELLGAINELRGRLGWLYLDMAHHHCWSHSVPVRCAR